MKWIGAQDLDRWDGEQIGKIEVARLGDQLVCVSAPMVGSLRWRRRHARAEDGFVIDKEGQMPEVYAERQATSEFEKGPLETLLGPC
jgi:hypothetical protein